jgi:SAM-dependent methyltransferase
MSEAYRGIDFGRTAEDYGRHRAGFPPSLFARLRSQGVGSAGQRIVDLGTGTGSLARGFALGGCRVTGIDLSPALMAQARELDRAAGVEVDYREARAEATGLPAGAFDVVAAGQCWHWFERERAAAEAWRLLRPGGCLCIAHFDWIPLPGNVAALTEALILKHNPAWRFAGGTGIHADWFADLSGAGFEQLASFSYDESVPYTAAAWRGRIRASAGVGASLAPEAVEAFDAEHAATLREHFPEAVLPVLHRVFVILGLRPDG